MPDPSPTASSKRLVLLVTTISSFLTPFMGSAINIALPVIGNELAMDAIVLTWVASSYILAAAMFLVPFGKLADIHGRKRVFSYGILIYTVASFLCGVASSAGWLIAFRVIQGLGGAMIFGTGVAILTSVYPPGERGKALGINVAAVYLGLSLGPAFGGFLTQHFGWRSVFYANVPLGLIIVVLVMWKLKGEWAEAKGEKFDYAGSIIYCLTLVAVMCGLSILPRPVGAASILLGILGLVAFVRWELKQRHPVLSMNLFMNNTVFAMSNLAALINYSATFASGFLLSLYLQYIKGLNPRDAGLILVAQPVMMAFLSPFAGHLSDRIESRVVASLGMAVTVAGSVMLIFLGPSTSTAYIILSLVILGVGFGLFSSPNTNAIMSSVEKKSLGVAAATLGTMRLTGQTLSLGMATVLFAVFVGKVQITQEYYPQFLASVRTSFIIGSAVCFAGIFISLARGKVRS
jgi:EmrB/QacA subfamily drug resistance transporter